MGCSSSSAAAAKAPPDQGTQGATSGGEAPTWATKTDVFHGGHLAQNDANQRVFGEGDSSLGSDALGGKQKQDGGIILLDNEDDDDEIEIILEAKPTATAREAPQAFEDAGNAQEAPTSDPPETVKQKAAAAEALSQRQKEEAKRLEEQRKRFENQRTMNLNKNNVSKTNAGGDASDLFTGAVPSAPPRKSQDVPELVMGLNTNGGGGAKTQAAVLGVEDCLPGGVLDDDDEVDGKATVGNVSERNRAKHEVFDDDDEMLMKEILDSVNVS